LNLAELIVKINKLRALNLNQTRLNQCKVIRLTKIPKTSGVNVEDTKAGEEIAVEVVAADAEATVEVLSSNNIRCENISLFTDF